ncbi:hypothetical protein [Rubripirellula tenax]|nr:hypothetical protein [Rubripirellula tenax]
MSDTIKQLNEYLLTQLSHWSDDDEHVELENHRIEEVMPGVLQYNLLEKRSGKWRRGFGIDCPEDRVDEISERLRSQGQVRWVEPRSSNLLLPETATPSSKTVFVPRTSPSEELDRTAKVDSWIHDSLEILEKLEDLSATEKDQFAAVLFAETKSFENAERDRLLRVLHAFIDRNRLTEDADRMVYVCSAIRKYAMNMGQDQFEAYCDWLLPTETTPVHHEVEMEFVKALSYRLQFVELNPTQDFPNALEIVSDLAFGYLRRSLILQKSYANTAMLALICVAVLESLSTSPASLTSELLEKVDSLKISWFKEMVEDNLEEAVVFVEQNSPAVYENLKVALAEN